jgi:hypothetical protein
VGETRETRWRKEREAGIGSVPLWALARLSVSAILEPDQTKAVQQAYCTSVNMAASRCCRRPSSALKSVFIPQMNHNASIPSFLLPAFTFPASTSSFSTSSQCRSKIGRAPLSLPPEVKFTVTQAPARGPSSSQVSRAQQGSVVEIEGPKGKMQYEMPPYMTLQGGEEERVRTLRILDAEDRKQREMWGEYITSALTLPSNADTM